MDAGTRTDGQGRHVGAPVTRDRLPLNRTLQRVKDIGSATSAFVKDADIVVDPDGRVFLRADAVAWPTAQGSGVALLVDADGELQLTIPSAMSFSATDITAAERKSLRQVHTLVLLS